MNINPYASPNHHSKQLASAVPRRHKRWVAYALIIAPFVLALPLRHWALNHAGSWFVSTDLEPDHRLVFLSQMYLGLILSIGIWCLFGASILLWRDSFYPVLSGIAALFFGLLAVPAGLFLAIGVDAYFKYG